MELLAPDQSEEQAAHLVAKLRNEASRLTYQEIQSKIKLASDALRTLSERRNLSFDALETAQAELQAQEAAQLVQHGGTFSRSLLRQWTDNVQKAETKVAAQRGEEARIRQTLSALTEELHRRENRRAQLVKDKLRDKHAPLVDAKLAAACTAMAEAICAQAWNQSGLAPGDVQPTLFLQNFMFEHAIREAVQRFESAERLKAEAEVKAEGDQ